MSTGTENTTLISPPTACTSTISLLAYNDGMLNRILSLDSRTANRIFLAFLFLSAIAQIFIIQANPLDLAADETHYWEWSKRLDYHYYSKGPVIAYLVYFGTTLFGDTALGVRFPAVLNQLVFTGIIYLFVRSFSSPGLALLTSLAIRSMLIFMGIGTIMTPDSPLALLWATVLFIGYQFMKTKHISFWVLAMLALGIAINAKAISIILFPGLLVAIFLGDFGFSQQLIKKALIVGFSLLLVSLLPFLLWNAKHEWVNFAHSMSHVTQNAGIEFRPYYFFELLGGQIILAGPILFLGVVASYFWGIKEWKNGDALSGFFVLTGLPLLAILVLISFTKRVQGNWVMPVYINGILLFAYLLSQGVIKARGNEKLILGGISLNLAIGFIAHLIMFGVTFGMPDNFFPHKKIVGWRTLASKVQSIQKSMIPETAEPPFFVSERYQTASELAFYLRAPGEIFCANISDRRMNQYDIWGGWEKLKGRDAIVVLDYKSLAPRLEPFFETVSYLGEINLSSSPRPFTLFLAKSYTGIPPEIPQRY